MGDNENKVGVDFHRKVTPVQAIALFIHHATLAIAYWEATGEDSNDAVVAAVNEEFEGDLAHKPMLGFVDALEGTYAAEDAITKEVEGN